MRGIPAHRRPVNTVFQSYALFPHLSVQENVAFGLRMQGVRGAEAATRVAEALEMVRAADFARRRPSELSGGQKQRVALARALVNRPKVLLLDEPLSALDRQLRVALRSELRELQRRSGITFIMVTHDQEEAVGLCHRVAVLRDGRVAQCGSPEALYRQPRSRFVAGFLGACNLIPGRVAVASPGSWEVDVGFARVTAGDLCARGFRVGEPVSLGIRPEAIRVLPVGAGGTAGWPGVIRERTFTGADLEVEVGLGDDGIMVRARVPAFAGGTGALVPGARVRIEVAEDAVMVLEDGP